jgi:integrase
MLRAAEAVDLLKGKPTRGLKTAHAVRAVTREDILSDTDMAALKAALPERYRLAVELMAVGMRLGEVFGLRRHRVTLKGDVLVRSQVTQVRGRLVEGPPKSSNGVRDLPLPHLREEMMRHIGEYAQPEADGFVFTSETGTPVFTGTFRDRYWRQALASAGLPYQPPHNLRHVAACRLADAGFSTVQVARWLGDTAATVESTYINVLPNAQDRMATVFNREEGVR